MKTSLATLVLAAASAVPRPALALPQPSLNIQPDNLSATFPQVIPRSADFSLNPISKTHLTLDPKNPRFTSLEDVKMDDAALVIGEWGPYTTRDGRKNPFKSKVFGYIKRYKPTDAPHDIELDILLDNVFRRKVLYCEDTVEIYSDTKNRRLMRADNNLENSTPYGHPTDMHRIIQIWTDNDRLKGQEVRERVHPLSFYWDVGDYLHPWQQIENKDDTPYEAVSFYDKSPNNRDYQHWIVGIRLPLEKYNPDDLLSLPLAIEMGNLPNGVFQKNEPYMNGHWIELFRGLYTPTWTIAGSGNDKRAWPQVIQP